MPRRCLVSGRCRRAVLWGLASSVDSEKSQAHLWVAGLLQDEGDHLIDVTTKISDVCARKSADKDSSESECALQCQKAGFHFVSVR